MAIKGLAQSQSRKLPVASGAWGGLGGRVLWVIGFGAWIAYGLGFRVSGLGFRVTSVISRGQRPSCPRAPPDRTRICNKSLPLSPETARVWGLGFGVWGLGFGVWGLGFGVWGLGFGVWGLGFRV